MSRACTRCGIPEADTPEGFLAYHGPRLVCADCDSDLNTEWAAEDPRRIHPLDTLNPLARL